MDIPGETEPFQRLLQIFNQNRHKKLEFLNLENVDIDTLNVEPKEYRQLMSELYALVTKCNLKC